MSLSTVLRPRARQITGRDLNELDACVAAGRAVIATACERVGVDAGAFWEALVEIYELKWQNRQLSDAGCDLFDAEARRRGLDPVKAAEDLTTAREIEALPQIQETWDEADLADTAARDLDRAWLREQQDVLEHLHAALALHVELCDETPALLIDAARDQAVVDALEDAVRWLPVAFVAGEEEAHLAWREWQRSRPTGNGVGAWWARFFQPGTGSGAGIALIDDFEHAFYDIRPQLTPPVGCQFIAAEDGGFRDSSASYRDWPRPTISYRRGWFGSSTCLHELAHWMEARLRPELARVQHTLLRLRQRGEITAGREAWSAPHRIPAAVLDPYQECWYAHPWEQPQAFELLSTTLARLEDDRRDVLHDPQLLAAALGGLVAFA